MFDKMRRARADLATMNTLFPAAERIARDDGIDQPAAEHLLLAALELDDGIATSALSTFDVDAAQLRGAIVDQHDEALRSIGVIADDNAIAAALPASEPQRGPYRAQGSLQEAFQHVVSLAQHDKAPINSGHVLLAVTDVDHGTVVRSLEHLGVDRVALRDHTRRLIAR
jgi:ATP-dependent Clp protease ATP-binding subunit ClpA